MTPLAVALVVASSFLVSACASGISCSRRPPAHLAELLNDHEPRQSDIADAAQVELASARIEQHRCWADTGDQVSQYLMGVAYEHGIGIAADPEQALAYYKRAASPRSNRTYVYSPAVGSESNGRVIPVTAGPDLPGLAAAQAAVARLESVIE